MLLVIYTQNALEFNQFRPWKPSIFTGIIALPLDKELPAALPPPVMLKEVLYYKYLGVFTSMGSGG